MWMLRLAALSVLLAAHLAAAAAPPPAWACATERDYYAKTSTVCATGDCNAAQRNIGGEVLILDTDSYGYTNCQGCNPSNPAKCCQRCTDTDGCNAWVACTNPDGCGSGCKKYLDSFGANARTSDNGGKTFGNFKSCAGANGDKWPANMCSLKFIKDTKNMQVQTTDAKAGWVSGITPKVQADPRCPPMMAAKNCKMCLGTKNVAKCIACVVKTKGDTYTAPKCVTCANLGSANTMDLCMKFVGSNNYGGNECMDADCDFNEDCINTPREKRKNAASVEACFNCIISSAAKAKQDVLKSATGQECFYCFNDSPGTVPWAKKSSCVSCLQAAKTAGYESTSACVEKNKA